MKKIGEYLGGFKLVGFLLLLMAAYFFKNPSKPSNDILILISVLLGLVVFLATSLRAQISYLGKSDKFFARHLFIGFWYTILTACAIGWLLYESQPNRLSIMCVFAAWLLFALDKRHLVKSLLQNYKEVLIANNELVGDIPDNKLELIESQSWFYHPKSLSR